MYSEAFYRAKAAQYFARAVLADDLQEAEQFRAKGRECLDLADIFNIEVLGEGDKTRH